MIGRDIWRPVMAGASKMGAKTSEQERNVTSENTAISVNFVENEEAAAVIGKESISIRRTNQQIPACKAACSIEPNAATCWEMNVWRKTSCPSSNLRRICFKWRSKAIGHSPIG